MNAAEKILKSLLLAGVEWELGECGVRSVKCEVDETKNNSTLHTGHSTLFAVPKAAAAVVSNNDVMAAAKRLASSGDLLKAISEFKEHPLFAGAKNTVLPVLPPAPKLLVITDVPSLADDAEGRILSGAEGELFGKMIAAVGLSQTNIAITPLVFWRPAGGRAPTKDELSFCRPFVDRIITESKAPKILTLGTLAAKEIAGAVLPRAHGKPVGNVIPIYKPEFIIANPGVKPQVWEALKLLK